MQYPIIPLIDSVVTHAPKGLTLMAKSQNRQSKRRGRGNEEYAPESIQPKTRDKSARHKANEAWHRTQANPLVCKGPAQERFLKVIQDNTIAFGLGPAGTGKTYVAVKYGCQQIDAGNYNGIVILRPLVEMGEKLGALPGELKEKMAPWATPFLKVLHKHYGPAATQAKLNGAHPSIEFLAIQHIRGDTFENKIVIVDEAQNTTPEQMKTILTRVGEGSKLIIDGDPDQSDIRGASGLTVAMDIIRGVEGVGVATFVEEDIVRHGIVRAILIAYRDHALAQKKKK